MLLKVVGVLFAVIVSPILLLFISMVLPFPFGLIVAILGIVGLIILAIVLWRIDNKLAKTKSHSDIGIEILKERYAKGEISKEEFDRMKENLRD